MNSECIRPRAIAEILAREDEDPRRRHVATCPSCRALAHAYTEFMDTKVELPGFDAESTDAELTRKLAAVLDRSPGAGRRWFSGRVWLATAALLFVCAGVLLTRDVLLWRTSRLPAGSGVVRGTADDPTALAWLRRDGQWFLTWRADTPGTSTVVFFNADLAVLERRSLVASGAAPLAAVMPPSGAVYLQLVFRAERDVVARSGLIAARPGGQ